MEKEKKNILVYNFVRAREREGQVQSHLAN